MNEKSVLETKSKELTDAFNSLNEKRAQLNEQAATVQRKITEVEKEKLRLQGEFRLVQNLLEGEPKEEKPKKK